MPDFRWGESVSFKVQQKRGQWIGSALRSGNVYVGESRCKSRSEGTRNRDRQQLPSILPPQILNSQPPASAPCITDHDVNFLRADALIQRMVQYTASVLPPPNQQPFDLYSNFPSAFRAIYGGRVEERLHANEI